MKKKMRKAEHKKSAPKPKKGLRKKRISKLLIAKRPARKATRTKGRRSRYSLTTAQLIKRTDLAKGNKYLSLSEAREKRELLLRLRERVTDQINFLATDNISRSEKDNDVSYRSEEQGTDNFDRDFALNRVSLDQEILFEIDDALHRLAQGTYGICDTCARGIEKARIKALPYSKMCVACQSKNESGRKKFRSFESAASFQSADKGSGEAGADEE